MSLHHVHYSRAKEGLMDLVLAKSVSVSSLGEVCECVCVYVWAVWARAQDIFLPSCSLFSHLVAYN